MKKVISNIIEITSNPLAVMTVGVIFFLFGSLVYFFQGILVDYFFYLAIFALCVTGVEYLWDLNTYIVEMCNDVKENKFTVEDKNFNDDLSLQNTPSSCIINTEISDKE